MDEKQPPMLDAPSPLASIASRRSFLTWTCCGSLGSLLLLGCDSKGPQTCSPSAGLTERERSLRTQLAYVEPSPTALKACLNCSYYVSKGAGECGGCTSIPGPIHPQATCALFREKL